MQQKIKKRPLRETCAEYRIWQHIKQRTTNPNDAKYPIYGGRGIRVCDSWMHSFPNFLKDMGCRPSTRHSIDRINNDGDYTPDNCRWATIEEQSVNKSSNVKLTLNGRTQTVSQWAKELHINSRTIYTRINAGWPAERILTERPRGEKPMTNPSPHLESMTVLDDLNFASGGVESRNAEMGQDSTCTPLTYCRTKAAIEGGNCLAGVAPGPLAELSPNERMRI